MAYVVRVKPGPGAEWFRARFVAAVGTVVYRKHAMGFESETGAKQYASQLATQNPHLVFDVVDKKARIS